MRGPDILSLFVIHIIGENAIYCSEIETKFDFRGLLNIISRNI
jgi:hypothetical protein